MSTYFKNSDELQTTINYFRSCKLFKSKNISGKKLRYLFEGLALEIARAEGKLQEISDEYDPLKTNIFLKEWEQAIGIPDECIPLEATNTDRRNWILVKLTSLGVSTKEGFEALGAILGFNLTVSAGDDSLSFPYTFPFILSNENKKWVMFVEGPKALEISQFPYTFPLIFTNDKTATLKCLFEALVPSNVKVLFNFV